MLKVTCAIIIRNDKILITQRGADSDHPWQWEFPGGKMKIKESAEECIIREIREELNVEIIILKKMNPVNYDYGFRQIKLIPFLCRINSGKIVLTEHHNYQWITLEQSENIDFTEADRELVELKENQSVLKEYFRENMDDSG